MEHKITSKELVAYIAGYINAKYDIVLMDEDILNFQWTAEELVRVSAEQPVAPRPASPKPFPPIYYNGSGECQEFCCS